MQTAMWLSCGLAISPQNVAKTHAERLTSRVNTLIFRKGGRILRPFLFYVRSITFAISCFGHINSFSTTTSIERPVFIDGFFYALLNASTF